MLSDNLVTSSYVFLIYLILNNKLGVLLQEDVVSGDVSAMFPKLHWALWSDK